MRLQRFPAGVKPLESDLNALSDNALDGIQDLISVFSGNSGGSVLFQSTDPITAVASDVLTITTPSQRVAIGGAVETSSDYFETFDVSTDDRYVEIFFVISRNPVTATRNFLSLDTNSGSTILQNLEAEIAEVTNIRVVYLTQTSQAVPANTLEPTLNSNDLGYARLGSVFHDVSAGTTVFTEDTSFGFTFPSEPTVTIPEVPVVGAENGLMTPALLATTLGSVQAVVANAPLSFASSGDNAAQGPKEVIASLDYGQGMTLFEGRLAPDFLPASAANGTTSKVARADHVHALSQSGVVRVTKEFQLSAGALGTLQDVNITAADLPENVTLASIMSVELFWAPSQTTEGQAGLSWQQLPSGGTMGARALISNVSTIAIELGDTGVLELSGAALQLATEWNGGVSVPAIPSTGFVRVNILALRDGANG